MGEALKTLGLLFKLSKKFEIFLENIPNSSIVLGDVTYILGSVVTNFDEKYETRGRTEPLFLISRLTILLSRIFS